jgi:hypothetical protein
MARERLHPAGASLVRRTRDSKQCAPHLLSHLFDGCDPIQNDLTDSSGSHSKPARL